MNETENENFQKFMSSIDSDLKKIFENQKEYVFCKEGCSKCCERGDYPLSQAEFDYMMKGFEKLYDAEKTEIKKNVKEINNTGKKDSYVCPFLIEHKCSVYAYRPFVCRAFGVLTEDAAGNPVYPFCTEEGLNYSEIYDKEKGHLSMEKVISGKFKNLPHFFSLSNEVMMKLPSAKELNINFGKTGSLIGFLNIEFGNLDSENGLEIDSV